MAAFYDHPSSAAPDQVAQQKLADEAVFGSRDLAKHGVDQSVLEVLRQLHDAVPPALGRAHCDQVLAAYLTVNEASTTTITMAPPTSVPPTETPSTAAPSTATTASPTAQVSIPDVTGLSEAQAANEIGQAGLSVGSVRNVPSDSVPQGDVVSTDPAADTTVPTGTGVTLFVSSGPPQSTTSTP
jgi:hypothetical protein